MPAPNDDGAVPPPPPRPPATAPDAPEEAVETLDAAEVEEIHDAELIDEGEAAPAEAAKGALEEAIAEAAAVRGDPAAPRRMAVYEGELTVLGASSEVDKARVALYQHEIGELLEESGDEGAAVKAYAKALQSDATLKPNLWAIRRVFQRRALWPNLLKLLDAEIRFARSDGERAELYLDKGELLEDKLKDVAGARDCYEKAVAAAPTALRPWMALEKLVAREGDAAQLARVWRGLAAATSEPGRKLALLVDLARLQANLPGGADAAIALCREAVAIGFESERALDELERQAEAAGRVDDLVWSLDRRVGIIMAAAPEAPLDERPALTERVVGIRRRQAQLLADRDPVRAWAALLEAQELVPTEPLLQRELAELAEAQERFAELAKLLERRVTGGGELPAPARLLVQLDRAAALRRAGQAAEAATVEAEVAREAPGHLGLLVAREREALKSGDWEQLAALYQTEAELAAGGGAGAPDPLWAAIALTQAGAIFGEHLGREGDAARALGQVLKLRPHFRPAVDALERLYKRTGRHAEHAALLADELEATPASEPVRQVRLIESLIAVRESGLDDAAGAAVAARRLVELRPDDVRARLRLVELDKAAARWADAAVDLAGLAALLPEERRVEALLERAELLERRLGDDAQAQEGYREVLALRPGEPRAVDAFEAISRRRGQASTRAGASAPPAAWDDLAAALRREADASLRPERIAAVLLKLGEIHERERGEFGDAAQAYRDLLDKAPGHAAALRGLQRASAALGDDARRAEALEQEIEALTAGRAEMLVELGELYEDRLAKDELADDAYGRGDAATPAVPSAHAALGRFRVAVRKRDMAALGGAMARLGELLGPETTPAAQAALADERAAVERLAGDRDRALQLLREAASGDETAFAPWLGRARLAARDGNLVELAADYEGMAARTSEPALKSALERRAGVLAAASGSADAAAVGRTLRRAATSDAAVLVPLAEVDPDGDLLAVRAALAGGAAEVEWRVERAEWLESTGRPAEAAREAARALEHDPRHLAALELVRRVTRAGGDDAGFARVTARLASDLAESERAAALWAEAGAAFEKIGQRDDAAAAYRAVLDRTPLDGAAFNRARALLAQRYAGDADPGPLVELLTHRMAHVAEVADRVALLLERAEICARQGDVTAAESDLRGVIQASPQHTVAMQRLADLIGASPTGRVEAVRLYQRVLELEGDADPVRRRTSLVRLAELEDAPGGHVDAAIAHLEAALALAPGAVELERLANLFVKERLWQKAVATLGRLAEGTTTGAARAAVEIRIATIYRDGFSDGRASAEALMRALHAEPLELDALAKLVAHAESGHVVQLQVDHCLDRAIEKARAQVALDPLQPAPYQALVRLWGWRSDEDARVVAAQAQALVSPGGGAGPAREGAVEPTRELSPAGWERLLPPGARTVALEIWRQAWEGAVKVWGPELPQLGVGKSERVNAKGIPISWIPVDKIARALGCAGYELYASPRSGDCIVSGAALVVGTALADRLTSASRVRVARKLVLLRERLGPLEKVDDDELALFFAACARVAEVARPPSLALGGKGEARVEELARSLQKTLGRKERKALQALGLRFAELGDPAAWRRAVLDGAARVALVVSGDLLATLGELELDVRRDGAARELVQLAMSEEYFALRRELGLRA
jgi:hypothetical protein